MRCEGGLAPVFPLSKSGSGKILKRILRERFWAHQERAVD